MNPPDHRAVFSFLNPGVFVVIAKHPKPEIRLRPFPEPRNSGGCSGTPSTPAKYGADEWSLTVKSPILDPITKIVRQKHLGNKIHSLKPEIPQL